MKKLLRFLLPIVCLAGMCEGAKAQYVSSGPNGGAVYSFYKDNGSSQIYATGNGGVYQSSNGGKSWQEINQVPSTFGCDPIYSVAVSGADMYAGSFNSGVFASHNGGANWLNASSGLPSGHGAPYTDIEIVGPNVLAIRADSGYLYFSNNQGMSWARINAIIGNSFALYLSIHNTDVYVSTVQGLFKSTDNGVNFTNIDPLPADFGKLIWVGDTAYVGTSTGIKMSTDGGMNFNTVALPGRAVSSVAVNGNNMYAVVRNPAPIQDSVLYSTNGGGAFSAAPFNASNFRFTQVYDLVATSNGVLVGSNYSLYSTTNSGNSWGLSDSGYNATNIRGLAVSGPWLFAGANPMGVYRVMPDSGALVWQHTGDVSHNVDGNIQTIAAKGSFIHAGGASGYYRSTDTGASWTAGASGATGGNITSIYASPNSSDVWMIRNGDLYYSSDDGASFGHIINSNIPGGVSQRVMKADTVLFVSSFAAFYKGGSTMSFSPTTGISSFVTAVVFEGGTFYAATDANGLYSSTDGASWIAVTGAPGPPARINALIADSAGTGLIAGTDNGFYSNTSGIWTQDGLAGHVVRSLAMRAGKLFVGTCTGVYSIPYKVPPPIVAVGNVKSGIGSMQVWPNPAKGDFSISMQCEKGTEGELVMRDIVGAVVMRQKVSLKAGANELHFSASKLTLAPGIYTLQVTSDGLKAAARVVCY